MKNTPEMTINDNNSNIENNMPVLFSKKYKKTTFNNLTYIKSDTGKTRHFTPAAQEWYNSVYSYNINYNKTLPVADTNLMRLLKTYFSIELNDDTSNAESLATRYKRLTTKKIFVGRGDLKHTSYKTIITFYVYDTNKIYLSRVRYYLKKALFYPKAEIEKKINLNFISKKKIVSYNRPFSLKEYIALDTSLIKGYIDYVTPYLELREKYLINLDLQFIILNKMVKINLITEEDKNNTLMDLYYNVYPSSLNYLNMETYMTVNEEYYISALQRFKYLLGFNDMKFSKGFMYKLIGLAQNIYSKKVEFNVVNLKKMHFNTDIFTQIVALKLKNRDNRLYRVLKASLRKVKLPNIYKTIERYYNQNLNQVYANRIRNNNVTSMFTNLTHDPLNTLLLDFYPHADDFKTTPVRSKETKKPLISFRSYVLKSLKHLKLRGIRVEAKGRLTRRFTASRSVFKLKWKGGLKNVESSFKGLSAILLRGHAKSNVQYSVINSKTRNGAFAVKGWISSK